MFDIARDPKVWERVRNDEAFARHRKEIKEAYDKASKVRPRCSSAWVVLDYPNVSDGTDSFRLLQSSALLSLIYPENEEYYRTLVEVVWEVCNEYTWAPLGHYNSYYDRTPADFDPGLIDIFAASLAFSMAEIKSLFKDRFPKLLVDRITYEIRRHTIEPFKTREFFWEKHNNNWTAVCTGAVGGVLMYEDPDEFWRQFPRLQSAMQCYLNSYDDDGMCVEGTAYWGFGFGFFSVYAMLLREFSNGKEDWLANPKVKAISQFIQKMHLQPNVLAMYSDVNAREGYWVGLPHMLKTVYGDAIENLTTDQATIVAYCHWAFAARSTVYYNPDFTSDKLQNATYYADVSNYFVKRTDNYGFALKGGNHWESHNHQDVGSFILARHNKQVFCDFGYIGPGHHPGYQSNRRNEYFQPSSYSHNLPYFNGKGEGGDWDGKARAVYNEETGVVYMDFTNGYDIKRVHTTLKKAERFFKPMDDKIEMHDKFEFSEPAVITERFVTTYKPRVEGNIAYVNDVRVICECDATLNVVEQPFIDQLPDENGNYNKICYLLDYTLNGNTTEFKATIDFKG